MIKTKKCNSKKLIIIRIVTHRKRTQTQLGPHAKPEETFCFILSLVLLISSRFHQDMNNSSDKKVSCDFMLIKNE